MKVSELIEKLRNYAPHTMVVGRGFDEHGYDEIIKIQLVKITYRPGGLHSPDYVDGSDEDMDALLIDAQG